MTQYTNKRDINARERMNMALEMRKAGNTLGQISAACGYKSDASAHKAIKRAMAELPRENAEALRTLEVARLDDLLTAWWQRAHKDINAAHLVLKLAERRARLCGLDITPDPTPPDVQIVVREVMPGFLGTLEPPSPNGHDASATMAQLS